MKTIPRMLALAATALAAVSILALAGAWLLRGDNLASANPVGTVGMDLDVSGNSANQEGNTEVCLSKSAGDKFEVDVLMSTLSPEETLGSFAYSLSFDDTRVKINTQNHLMLLNLQEGSAVNDTSEAVPDVTSPHHVTVTDYTAPEGDYTAPETHVQGVLGRYEVEVVADAPPGLVFLTPTDVVLRDATGSPLNLMYVNSVVVAVGVPCPTPVPSTPSPSPSPVASPSPSLSPSPNPSPTPMPTLTPFPGPPPTLEPVPPTPEAEPSPLPTATPTPTAPAPKPTPALGASVPIALPSTGAGSASGSSWPWWSLAAAGAVAGAGAMLLTYQGLRAKPH